VSTFDKQGGLITQHWTINVCWKKQNLRYLQCRNLIAAQVPYVTKNLTTEPELYVTYSAETCVPHLFSLLLASVVQVFTWITQLLSQWRYVKYTPQTLAVVAYSIIFEGSCETYKSSLRVSQRCYWELRFSEMWRHVDWWVVPDVSKNHGAFNFRAQAVQEKGDTIFHTSGTTHPRTQRPATWILKTSHQKMRFARPTNKTINNPFSNLYQCRLI